MCHSRQVESDFMHCLSILFTELVRLALGNGFMQMEAVLFMSTALEATCRRHKSNSASENMPESHFTRCTVDN